MFFFYLSSTRILLYFSFFRVVKVDGFNNFLGAGVAFFLALPFFTPGRGSSDNTISSVITYRNSTGECVTMAPLDFGSSRHHRAPFSCIPAFLRKLRRTWSAAAAWFQKLDVCWDVFPGVLYNRGACCGRNQRVHTGSKSTCLLSIQFS